MKTRQHNVGIVTFPIARRGNVPLSNLASILSRISNHIYIITGNEGEIILNDSSVRIHLFKIYHKSKISTFARIKAYIYTQVRISYRLVRLSRKADIWVFFFGEALLLPALTARLLRNKVVLAFTGSATKAAQVQKDPLAKVSAVLQNITFRLSNRIVMYSKRLIEEHGFQKYRHKISIAREHFLDFDKFRAKREFGMRDNLVGYIGALSKEKGIPNLLEAIQRVLERGDRIEFLIGGDGELRSEIEEYSRRKNLSGKVKFVGWIPHDELPNYLSELKLLVLPSYTEGLPNIMLETMVCGTPVLATAVGAIPDIIKDGETGFILEDNSPETIAKGIIRALNHPNLEQIAANARALVEGEFTFEAAVKRWQKILAEVL